MHALKEIRKKNLDDTKRCAKENYLSWSEAEMKNNSMKYAKSENTAVFRLILQLSRWGG